MRARNGEIINASTETYNRFREVLTNLKTLQLGAIKVPLAWQHGATSVACTARGWKFE